MRPVVRQGLLVFLRWLLYIADDQCGRRRRRTGLAHIDGHENDEADRRNTTDDGANYGARA